MERNIVNLMEEYKSADFNRRLHMYLQFPELRSEFILIDQNDSNEDSPKMFKSVGERVMNFLPSTIGYRGRRLCP